ncbi:unnamed protein product [Closterium sp. Naga37s-1]|nr:unnamed protein product [Closterium sp. Naga37s-1]
MQGRVGDRPAGAGACFVGGFLSVAAPTSRHSFRYDGPRPPPSGQTQPESGSEEEDEEEEGEGEEDEDDEGSGDDSEAGWDPETHGGGEGGDDEEDHEMDGLELEEVEEGANPAKPKPVLKLVQGSHTRWGSTHDMVERAGVLQNPITVFFAQTQGLSKTDKKKVESLRLTDADWETLQAVKTFLSPFAKVSKADEGAAYPTVSMVVSYYNGLIDAMESRLAKGPSPTLQPMIVAALSHLKKYAYITSNEYWIATFLDPSMNAAWFDDAHWEKLHPETDRRVRPRPASGEVIKLVRDRVAEYQARAAELAPRPTPLAPVAEEEGDEAEDHYDAQLLLSRRQLAARLSANQEAGGGWDGEGRRPRGVAPPEFAIEGEGAEEDDEEEEEGVEADDTAGGEDAAVGSSSGALA